MHSKASVRALSGLVLALACGSAAAADALDADRHFTAGAFWVGADSARGADRGLGATVGYGWWTVPRLWTEARLFGTILETQVKGASDFYQKGAGLDVLYYFQPESQAGFYALAGGGVVQNDVTPDSEDSTNGYFNAGLGFRTRPQAFWGMRVRTELRWMNDRYAEGQNDLVLGLTLELSPKRERVKLVEREVVVEKLVQREVVRTAPAVAETEPVSDRDGDGIIDVKDLCPDTLPGAKIGIEGCAVPGQP